MKIELVLGELIKNYRKENELSQAEMGKVLGIIQQAVGRLEAGKISTSIGNAEALLNKIGYRISFEKVER